MSMTDAQKIEKLRGALQAAYNDVIIAADVAKHRGEAAVEGELRSHAAIYLEAINETES